MSETKNRKKTCNDRIDNELRNRLAELLPDFENMELQKLEEYIEEYAELPESFQELQCQTCKNSWVVNSNSETLAMGSTIEHCQKCGSPDVTVIINLYDENGNDYEEILRELAQETFYAHVGENILSVEQKTVYNICLSWGGPADYFELEFTDGQCTGGFYLFQDWFDGARRKISPETAERLANLWAIGPEFER